MCGPVTVHRWQINDNRGEVRNRMKKRSIICLLLAILLLLPAFGSCSKKPDKDPAPTDTPPEDERIWLDDLGNFDFGLAQFNVLSVTSTPGTYTQFDNEGLGGDALDESVYNRNREIEERFNILFHDEYDSYQNCFARFNKQVDSNDNSAESFDLIMLINRDAYSAVLNGAVLPVKDIPHIDQNKNYYLHDINETMTLNGQQFLCYSDESLYTFQRTTCLAYNQAVANANSMPDFYQMVRDGEWTFEEMFSYMAMVATVDHENESNTFYGLYGHGDYIFSTFYAAAGENFITKTSNSLKFNALSSERMDTITNQVLDQMRLGRMGYSYDYNRPDDCYSVFTEGKCLFVGTVIGKLLLLREIKGWDYGVLPYPKYDKDTQDRYYSRVVDAWLHVAPRYVKDLERTGVILEALASGSAQHVFPAFYEKQITGKAIRDPESREMLELIRYARVMDWGGTVFATTIRSEVEKDVFVKQTESLPSLCRSIISVVNSQIKEAEKAANALAQHTAGQ